MGVTITAYHDILTLFPVPFPNSGKQHLDSDIRAGQAGGDANRPRL